MGKISFSAMTLMILSGITCATKFLASCAFAFTPESALISGISSDIRWPGSNKLTITKPKLKASRVANVK